MEEKSMSHEESLKIIETMIETARKKVSKLDSYYSIMWGYLVLVASLLNYYLLYAGYGPKANNAWFLMFAGGLASIWISLRRNKEKKVRTYFDKVLFYLWVGFIICIFIVVLNGKYISYQITPLILLLYGIALLVNGGIFNFKPQMIGALVAWAGCFIAFRLKYPEQLLVQAAVVLISHIIPGHLLYNMARKDV